MTTTLLSNGVENRNGTNIVSATGMPDPWSPSWSYIRSMRDWQKIRDILGGADAMRAKKEAYLPKYGRESQTDYDRRVKHAPFENHFSDALDSLSDKPFTKEIKVKDATPELKLLLEDLDGEGASLHMLAHDVFKEGAAVGRSGIFVDYPELTPGSTKGDADAIQARPYWLVLTAEDILTLERTRVGGKSIISKLRFMERREEVVSNISIILRTIRSYTHDGVGAVAFESVKETGSGSWESESKGELRGMTHIPFVEFITGRRDRITGKIIPPLLALADLQIEHYEQSSNLKHILRQAAFPMLCGNGVEPPTIDPETKQPMPLYTGPAAVLFAPPVMGATQTPTWAYLEPEGTSIEKLMNNLDRIEAAIDKLGKAPLVRSTGNITATSDAIGAAKGHAAAEAWAGKLKEQLELALYYTSEWLGSAVEIDIDINLEFGISENQAQDTAEIRANYQAGLLSKQTAWSELQRRNALSSSFDPIEEAKRIAAEQEEKTSFTLDQIKRGAVADPASKGKVLPFPKGKSGKKSASGKGGSAPAAPVKQAA